jgi:glycoprotein endo-alpha-1,2-mannosidase
LIFNLFTRNSLKITLILGSPWDALIPKLLDSAQTAKIKLTFHLEPYQGRTARSVRDDIKYIMESYGSHPAFYRAAKKTHEKQGDEGKGDEEKELPLFYM